MSSEDDQLKGLDGAENPDAKEAIDPESREWGQIINGWRNMQRIGAPVEFSHLKALLLLKAGKDKVGQEKAKVEIVTTIGTPNPSAMEAIAKNVAGDNRNKLPELASAVFQQTSGPMMYALEMRFNISTIDDISSGIQFKGYDVLRVGLRDDTESIEVSYATKPIDDVREHGQGGRFIPFSDLRENPAIVTDRMNEYFHAHAPLDLGVY